MVEKFAPSVLIDGTTVTPPGWMWILGFALGGCDWAIEQADTEDFRETVRGWLRRRGNARIERVIKFHQREIEKLKRELQ